MDSRFEFHSGDEYDRISDLVLRRFDLQAEDLGWGRHDEINTAFSDYLYGNDALPELEELRKQIDTHINTALDRMDDFSFTNVELRWEDGSTGRPLAELYVGEDEVQDAINPDRELACVPKKTLDEHLRFLFCIPDGEDTKEFFKAVPYNTKLDMLRVVYLVRQAGLSILQQSKENPAPLLKTAATITAFGVLASGVMAKTGNGTEHAMGEGTIDAALVVDRKTEAGRAIVAFDSSNQDIKASEKAAEELLGVTDNDVVIDGNKIVFSGNSTELSDNKLIAGTLEAQRPDTQAKGAAETTVTKEEKSKFPTIPEEKFAAEKVAIKNALDHAIETNDLGPLNNIVANSPIFQPRYDLPGDLENGKVRTMPPANLLGIQDLDYEFSMGTPDKERNAVPTVISMAMATAYKFRKKILENPELSAKYPDSCIRMGDFSADEGHKSHFGAQVDITSVMKCDVFDGHKLADGPVFWINHTEGGIDQNITNPAHNEDLDNSLLEFIVSLNIDGDTVVRNILYSKPNSPGGVQPFKNHSHHIHANGKPAYKDLELKHFANGGERPEKDLNKLMMEIYENYNDGNGVEGISKIPGGSNASESLNPQEKYNQAMQLLLDEIASGEGVWDSVNMGHSGDTKIGSAKYNEIFDGRKLSELSIKELIDLQRAGKVFAVGRYQMIAGKIKNDRWVPGTFESAVQATGIDVNRKFDESAQNELAINYLIMQKRPDLANYIKGESNSLDAALLALAQEWASFPAPHSYNVQKGRPLGSSYYYDDSAGNKSKGGQETIDRLTMILVHLRDTYQKKGTSLSPDSELAPVAHQPEITSSVKDLVGIGDSLTFGLEKVGMEDMDGGGINVVDINGLVGRSLAGGPSKEIPDNGVMVLDKMIAEGKIQDAEFVYFAFGTNHLESDEVFENELRESINRISEVSNARVLLPLLFSNVKHKDSRNGIIKRVAEETGAKVINPGEGIELTDKAKIHPGRDGYKEMARRIIAEVNSMDINPPKVTVPEAAPTTLATEQTSPEADSSTAEVTSETVKEDKTLDQSIGRFSKEEARGIYSIWFEEKVEVDGRVIKTVDTEALDEWMNNLKPVTIQDGLELYEIRYDKLPDRK